MKIFLSYRLRFLNASQARLSFLLKRMCGVMIAKKGCNSSWIVELNTLWYVGFQPFFPLSYCFLEFDKFIFSFQYTYNSRLKEGYGDDLSAHPDLNPNLCLEAGSSGGPDIIRVYELSNTATKNLRKACSVSSVGCSQLILST